jgi:hypothetical protein
MKTPTEDTPVSERKWTKGPWLFRAKSSTVHKASDTHPYGDQIFEFVDGFEDETMPSDADLKLVLAAPELYEALKSATAYIEALESFTGYNLEVLNWHKNGDTAPFDGFFDENRGDFDLAKARAALQRAEGEV